MPPFFRNKRKEITKMPKIYFNDLGLANMITANFSDLSARSNLGAMIENYCFNQLRYFLSISDNIFFWRTLEGAEVDFIWKKDNVIIPIEIKWNNFKESDIPVGVKNFCAKFKNIQEAWIITKDYSETKIINKIKFHFIPAIFLIKKIKNQ